MKSVRMEQHSLMQLKREGMGTVLAGMQMQMLLEGHLASFQVSPAHLLHATQVPLEVSICNMNSACSLSFAG